MGALRGGLQSRRRGAVDISQQDTEEYPKSEGAPNSEFSGSQKGRDKGGDAVWWESEQATEGERGGEKMRKEKGVGGKGSESTLEKLRTWYPCDLGTL